MQHKVFWSRWVHGSHKASAFESVKAAVRAMVEAENAGECGRSQVVVGQSAEDLVGAKVVVHHSQVAEVCRAFESAHPKSWQERSVEGARGWNQMCREWAEVKVN